MSNLIKSVYFNVDPSKVCVIDSDEHVEDYIPDIYNKPQEVESFEFPSLEQETDEGGQEFTEGFPSLISMQDVVDEEREKINLQMREKQESILEEARQEAERILEDAKQEAEQTLQDARNQGIEEGRAEGKEEARQELEQMRQQLQAEYDERFQELENQEKNLEPEFADLVISLVRKLTGVVCEDKKDVILYLIGNALKNKEKTKQLIIRVSKEDMGRVSAKKPTFKKIAGEIEEFDVVEDESLKENQCIIETDSKVIDCSMDAQLQNLEEHIKMLVF